MNDIHILTDYLTSSLGYSVIGFIVGFIVGRITEKFDIFLVQWIDSRKTKGAHKRDHT
jgi:hypothetical protein